MELSGRAKPQRFPMRNMFRYFKIPPGFICLPLVMNVRKRSLETDPILSDSTAIHFPDIKKLSGERGFLIGLPESLGGGITHTRPGGLGLEFILYTGPEVFSDDDPGLIRRPARFRASELAPNPHS